MPSPANAFEILVKGLPSRYEAEHLFRVFYPGAAVRGGPGTRGKLLYARAGKNRLAAALRGENGAVKLLFAKARPARQDTKLALCRLIYDLLCLHTGLRPPWGLLTGVRPLSLLRKKQRAGGQDAARRHFLEVCDVSREKYELALEIAGRQAPVLARYAPPACSLYVSVPFCPTRCAYCSFVSRSVGSEGHLIPAYLKALERELAVTADAMRACGLRLASIYIGGGTPTALSAPQLEQLLAGVARHFDTAGLAEYTVEAGRPDCTGAEKLALLKASGVTRVSINPQSMQQNVLGAIGRGHTAADILRCYADARAAGIGCVNMDVIAGLPGDDAGGFADTLARLLALEPENLTLHTLTLKRASDLARRPLGEFSSPSAMLEQAALRLRAAGYAPYYLYRQKSSVENLENTGWCRPGCESVYNICIMEEVHSILAVGAGAVTKLVGRGGAAIKRSYNFKFPKEYIDNIGEVLRRKQGVNMLYAGNLDTQTTG